MMFDPIIGTLNMVSYQQDTRRSHYRLLRADGTWCSPLTDVEDLPVLAAYYQQCKDTDVRLLHVTWSPLPDYTAHGTGHQTVHYGLLDARDAETLLAGHLRYLKMLEDATDWVSLDRYFQLTMRTGSPVRYVVTLPVDGSLRPHLFASREEANLFLQSVTSSWTAYAVHYTDRIQVTELPVGNRIDRRIPAFGD